MSKINELINKLCPNGVEYKTIKEIAISIYRGSGIKRDEVTEEGVPCVRYGEIYTSYNIWFDRCISHTRISNVKTPKYFEKGDILFAITGESIEEIAKSIAYVGNEKCLAGGDIVVLKHNQNAKYLSYALSTTDAQKQKSMGKVKSKVVHSSVPAIEKIRIPIPPIEIQEKIVRILDEFKVQMEYLTDSIMSECTLRLKQYEIYKEKILTFAESVETRKLRDLVDFKNGKGHEKSIDSIGKYIVVNSKFISTQGKIKKYSQLQICPLYKDDILMVMSDLPNGRALAKCYLVDQDDKYTLNQRIGAFHVKNENIICTKFLYYVLDRNQQLLKYDNGIDQTNLKKDDILDVLIPVPSIEEQIEIVQMHERLTNLYDEIESRLLAEKKMRNSQYMFYRDEILTFIECEKKEV